jgi:hypothetical protein
MNATDILSIISLVIAASSLVMNFYSHIEASRLEKRVKELENRIEDIERLRAERDEARREACAFVTGRYRKDCVTLDRMAAIAEAWQRGWDCFKEKP